jgi:hypothetical protein
MTRDVYCESRIRNFSHPGSRGQKAPDLGSGPATPRGSNYAYEDVLIVSSSPVEEASGQKDGRTDISPEEAARHSLETISSHSANKGVRGKKRKRRQRRYKNTFFYS